MLKQIVKQISVQLKLHWDYFSIYIILALPFRWYNNLRCIITKPSSEIKLSTSVSQPYAKNIYVHKSRGTHSHKKRVEGFILSAMDKPIPVQQYKNKSPCFRDITNDGILGAKSFYIRKESQSQRIEASLKDNSSLDYVPFNNSSFHHFRQFEGKGLKYKPLNHSMRVREFLDRQELNYLPNSTQKKDKVIKKALKGQPVDQKLLNKTLNKSLLPTLHSKTYFKSVSTLFNEIPSPTRTPEHPVVLDESTEEGEVSTRSRHLKPKEHLSRKQNSREVLVKCNMLPMRS